MEVAHRTRLATLLLNTVYTLNKSRTKSIVIGFDQIDGEQEEVRHFLHEPVLQIVDSGFNGIQFTCGQWLCLKKVFGDVTRYFEDDDDDDLRDRRVYGDGWSLRFTYSHSAKAIEIEDDRRIRTDGEPVKRARHSVVMKKVTFDGIREIVNCVDNRFDYLNSIKKSVSSFYKLVIEFMENKCQSLHEAQIQLFTSALFKQALAHTDEQEIKSLKPRLAKFTDSKDPNSGRTLYDYEIICIFYELVVVRGDRVINSMNARLGLDNFIEQGRFT